MKTQAEKDLTYIHYMLQYGYEAQFDYYDFQSEEHEISDRRMLRLVATALSDRGEQVGSRNNPKISDKTKTIQDLGWQKKYDFRNLVNHAYGSVDSEETYDIVENYLGKRFSIVRTDRK